MFCDKVPEGERIAEFITIAQPSNEDSGPTIPPELCETNITPLASIGHG